MISSYAPEAAVKLERFKEIWLLDTEFSAPPGHLPRVVCVVARELRSGQLIRLWEHELASRWPPYSIGPDSLLVAYFASAEWQAHLSLGWALPDNVLDLYIEFMWLTNGVKRDHKSARKSLLGALQYFGARGISSDVKDAWRDRIQRLGPWTLEEKDGILDYCQSDVDALGVLLPRMLPEIEIDGAIHRGRFTKCVARMQHVGIPVDVETFELLREHGPKIRRQLVDEYETTHGFGVYEDMSFRQVLFDEYLVRHDIPWPRLPSGALDLKDQTFKDMALLHPQFADLRELRQTLVQLRELKLAVGPDGRNRTLLGQFGTVTSRNAPRAGEFLFGPSRWIRGLMKPGIGRGVAYLDWSAQEVAIAGALSGDTELISAYESGDPYLSFGKRAGIVPENATKQSHGAERDILKTCVLGVGYGMLEDSLAKRIKRTPIFARDLLKRHRTTYSSFWRWVEEECQLGYMASEIRTPFGWRMTVAGDTRPTTVQNWPIQSLGAEMLRVAIDMMQESGITVCAPVHDAVVIEADLTELEDIVRHAKTLMRRASLAVTRGAVECRVDVGGGGYLDRYMDGRREAQDMWPRVMRLLQTCSGTAQAGVTETHR